MSQFITANRGGSEEFKLEYEGTFVLSTLTEEQKTAQVDLLTTLIANPEQSMMLLDHVEGKTTYFTAARMDSEGNLKYEIRSYTEKEEEEEEKPIDKVEGSKLEEATLNLELGIDIDKQEEIDNGVVVAESLLVGLEVVSEQETERTETLTIQDTENIVIQTEINHLDTAQIAVDRTIDNREHQATTLEDRIIELLKDEPENKEPEQTVTTAEQIQITEEPLAQSILNIEIPIAAVTVETITNETAKIPAVVEEAREKEITAPVAEEVPSEKVVTTKVEIPIATTETPVVVIEAKATEVKAAPIIAKTIAVEKPKGDKVEAIVLSINRNEVNNIIRNEAPISLEKLIEEKLITEENLKAKLLNGHEILLQILGISQNTTELRNAEPANSRSVPNINQEEQETKSIKSIPSIYQQRNLNGITLKIVA